MGERALGSSCMCVMSTCIHARDVGGVCAVSLDTVMLPSTEITFVSEHMHALAICSREPVNSCVSKCARAQTHTHTHGHLSTLMTQ